MYLLLIKFSFCVFLYSQWRLRRLPLWMHLQLSSHISTYCNYDFYLDQYLHNNKNVRFEALSVYIICIYELLTNMKSYDFREPWTCCPESTRSSGRRSIGTPSSGRINKACSFFCLYWILKSFLVSIFFSLPHISDQWFLSRITFVWPVIESFHWKVQNRLMIYFWLCLILDFQCRNWKFCRWYAYCIYVFYS